MTKVLGLHHHCEQRTDDAAMTLLLHPPHPRLDHRRYSSHTLTTALPTQPKKRLEVPGAFPSPVHEDPGARTPTATPSGLARELGYVPRQHTLHPAHKQPLPAQEYFTEYATYQRRRSATSDGSESYEASSSDSHSPAPSPSPRVRALEPPHLPTLYELRSSSSSSASTSRRAASEASSPPHRLPASPARSYTDPSRTRNASPSPAPRDSSSLRERMLSSLGLGASGGTAVDIPPATRNVARSMDGHHARRASVDAGASTAADPRSVSSSSMGSAQKAFGALIAGDRESSAATPRPPDVSATPRPGAVQAAAAANAAANAQMQANGGAGEPSWRSWVRGARGGASGREASDATLHDRRVSVLTSDDERILREEPDVDYAAMSAANGQRFAKDSFGRNSTASTGAGSYLPTGEEARSRHGECNDAAVRRDKRKKRHAPPELLVIVRPPPSKQSNPLNLQIQLVTPVPPPSANNSLSRNSTGEVSMDDATVGNTSMSSSGSGLRRSGSITSNRSMRSEVSSGGVSTASSSGAGRRVTPLYNLSFHQILATTVTDAGTDQKVAKFGRKGVEIDGFGHLEPRELVQGLNDLRSLTTNGSSHGPLSAGGSDLSPPRGGSDVGVMANLAPTQEPPTSYEAMTAEAKADSIGGKLLNKFKRLSLQARPSTTSGVVSTPASASPLGRFNLGGGGGSGAAHTKRASIDMGASSLADSLLGSGSDIPQLTPAGGLSAEGTRRTDGYVWTVRRFTRRANDDEAHAAPVAGPDGQNAVLANVWRRFNMHNRAGAEVRHPPAAEIPIRFEWTKDRERARRFKARSRRTSAVSHARSATDSATSGGGGGGPRVVAAQRGSFDISGARALRPPSAAGSRPSSVHAPRRSTDGSALDDTGSSVAADDDDEDADDDDGAGSDPEDSETPWSCHLVLGPDTRIPIGSLAPAPYHPKLVGQLAVPFPLPDLSASGLGADGAGLTREELKDIVNVTCLFLVIREGWGGLAKNKRKA